MAKISIQLGEMDVMGIFQGALKDLNEEEQKFAKKIAGKFFDLIIEEFQEAKTEMENYKFEPIKFPVVKKDEKGESDVVDQTVDTTIKTKEVDF